MCGIAGILALDNHSAPSSELIRKMTDAIQHRGPDDEGFFVNGKIGLGHRRLAIIDLSRDGHQPMASADGSAWIVYNGEIYNFRELRTDLQRSGHHFTTQNDTEVLLHAYQEYGPGCVTHLRGMFAFAIWDNLKQQLFLARDRFGIKPLYICRTAPQFLFASEIKALLAVVDNRPRADHQLIYDFLTLGLLDHTDQTFFAGIRKVPPAHYLIIGKDGQEKLTRYWDFEVNTEVEALSEKVIAEKSQTFFSLFTEAVNSHLISDVPVGSCLSGGLDSSAVVSVISRMISENSHPAIGSRQQTFSACYEQAPVDEQHYIDRVIDWTKAISHRVFPEARGFEQDLPRLLWHQEEPFASTSIYAQWEVMREARHQGVVVLLDGQGADEQLLGYRKFYVYYIINLLRRGQRRLGFRELIKHFAAWDVLKTLQLRRGLRYAPGRRLGSTAVAHEVLHKEFAGRFDNAPFAVDGKNDLGARIKADMTRFSLPVLLRYEDKNSMAFSRESRVPFLDHPLVEYVAALPLNLKLRDGWTKYCLRRGGRGIVPDEILQRKDKIGFATPEDCWFRETLKDDIRETLAQAKFLPEFVNVALLENHFEAYLRGNRRLLSSEFFFRFFILEQWARLFMLH